jgi:hypothetical protein
MLTFAGESPGGWVREVTPTAEALTVRQRHSFVELPGPGFTPRAYDPRAGYFSRLWYDYAAAFPGPLERRFISRHRLVKRDPRAAVSEAVQPIVYYLDSGVPEPVRTACSTARAGGTRPSRRRATGTPIAWRSCPTRPTPWTCGTM